MAGKRYNVLFICRDNAVHGIMAEALLKRWGDADFCAFSAGIKASAAIDPGTLHVLRERRVWHSGFAHQRLSGIFAAEPDLALTLPVPSIRKTPRANVLRR